ARTATAGRKFRHALLTHHLTVDSPRLPGFHPEAGRFLSPAQAGTAAPPWVRGAGRKRQAEGLLLPWAARGRCDNRSPSGRQSLFGGPLPRAAGEYALALG